MKKTDMKEIGNSQQELLELLENKENCSDQLVEYKPLENGSYLTLAKVKDDQGNEEVVILCGNQRVCTETFPTFEAAEFHVEQKPWEIIINMIGFMSESITKEQIKVNNAKLG